MGSTYIRSKGKLESKTNFWLYSLQLHIIHKISRRPVVRVKYSHEEFSFSLGVKISQ